MKNIKIYEEFNNVSKCKIFTDSEINYYQKLWDFLPVKYTTNPFFKSLFTKLKNKQPLSQKQWIELEFLLKNGKSRYEAGILPNNY